MGLLKKVFIAFIAIVLFQFALIRPVSAAGIVPSPEDGFECQQGKPPLLNKDIKEAFDSKDQFDTVIKTQSLDNVLGCAVKTGKIRLYMMPFFITNLIQFLLQIAGLIAVLFVVHGGFLYVTGGISDKKEEGKKAVFNALLGLLVALSAWIVVNFVQIALTS